MWATTIALAGCGRSTPDLSSTPIGRLEATPLLVDFGRVPVGTIARAQVTLSNKGRAPVFLNELVAAGSDFEVAATDTTTIAPRFDANVSLRVEARRQGIVLSSLAIRWNEVRTSTITLRYVGFDGSEEDGGVPAGSIDGGSRPDTGFNDAGSTDSGSVDTGPPDTGSQDTGVRDSGVPPDAGFPDAGFPDAGFPDAGFPDAGFPDAGFPDSGVPSPSCVGFGPVPESCPDSSGRIGQWMTLGTFPHGACGTALNINPITPSAQPRLGDTAGGRTWIRSVPDQFLGAWTTPCQPTQSCGGGSASVDLNCVYSGGARTSGAPDNVYGFAVTYLHVAQPLTARMRVGSDDGIRIWLDGQLAINEPNQCACWSDDQFETTVNLSTGVHTLLVQVGDASGHWGFTLRFTDMLGIPIRNDLHAHLFP